MTIIPRYIHLQATYVHAEETEASLAVLSQYIRRARETDIRGRMPVVDAESYMLRRHQHAEAQAEVVGHAFFCDGPWSAHEVWREVDAAARTKSGRYSRRGGRRGGQGSPRLGIFVDASLPLGIEEAAGIAIAHKMARLITATYGCAVEVVCHRKSDGVDHAHFLISMRRVDASGVHEMIREFNGVASRLGPEGVGKKRLSGHMEWMRTVWALLLTEATGIEHCGQSYERQGLDIKPLRHVGRSRIEIEARDGVPPGQLGWREEHALQKAKRSSIHFEAQGGSTDPVIAPSLNSNDVLMMDRVDPIGSLGDNAASDLAPSNAGLVPHEHEAPVREPAVFLPTDPGQAVLPTPLPQSFSRRGDGVETRNDGHKSGSDVRRPTPARAPFKIVSEGSPEIVARTDRWAVGMPSSNAAPAQPVTAATQDLSISHALVRYAAALLQSRQTTADNIGRLAGAAGMERFHFESAVQQTADKMVDKSSATIKAEAKAQVGASRADLLALLEDIERERRKAKAASRKKKADTIRAESRLSIEAGKETRLSDARTDNASTPAVPSRSAQTAETPAASYVAAKPSPIARSEEPRKAPCTTQESRTGPVQRQVDLQTPTTWQPHKGRLATDPPRRDEVESVLDIAALLSWRGTLQQHMSTIVKICRMTVERVRAEVSLRGQAFAQMGISKKELLARAIAKARKSDHPSVAAFIDAITTREPRAPRSPPVREPKHSSRDIDIKGKR